MTEEQKELLQQANVPMTWWEFCTIKDGTIYTPSTKTLYEKELVSEEEYKYWLSQQEQIDICALKEKKIQESKEQLATWLANNPMLSEIHNPEGEYYTVTQEKQTQLTQLLMLYTVSVQAGGEMQLTWNRTGGVCEEWTYEELSTLSFQIAGYVLPRVKKQQMYEVRINECTTAEEVNEIEIEYESID